MRITFDISTIKSLLFYLILYSVIQYMFVSISSYILYKSNLNCNLPVIEVIQLGGVN